MAGTIVANTINTDTGVFSTQNAYQGIAKAWVNFNGGYTNTAGVINGSFNVSSITVSGTGSYVVNFTTAMSNATYAPVGVTNYGNTGSGSNLMTIFGTLSTSSCPIYTVNATSAASQNTTYISYAFFD